MPNLINTDSAGNVFYNYITPVSKGVNISSITSGRLDNLFTAAYGTKGTTWQGLSSNTVAAIRFPATELAGKTGTVSFSPDNVHIRARFNAAGVVGLHTQTGNGTSYAAVVGSELVTDANLTTNVGYAVANSYAVVECSFKDNNLNDLVSFNYVGALREPVFTSTEYPLGLVSVFYNKASGLIVKRVAGLNGTSSSDLSTAADTITSPPIVCTTGTDPGDGSETFTDIVIRDAASPNNPVGKLWNCIDMPATCNVGELWKNTGAYDGDASASEQDIYLCVMPWGTRKLGMRVWTENIT